MAHDFIQRPHSTDESASPPNTGPAPKGQLRKTDIRTTGNPPPDQTQGNAASSLPKKKPSAVIVDPAAAPSPSAAALSARFLQWQTRQIAAADQPAAPPPIAVGRGILSEAPPRSSDMPQRPMRQNGAAVTPLPKTGAVDSYLRRMDNIFPALSRALKANFSTTQQVWNAVPKDYWSNGPRFADAMHDMLQSGSPYDPNTGKLRMVAHLLAHAAVAPRSKQLIATDRAEALFAEPDFIAGLQKIKQRIKRQSTRFAVLMRRKIITMRDKDSPYTGKPKRQELETLMRTLSPDKHNATARELLVQPALRLYACTLPPIKDGLLAPETAAIAKALKIKPSELAKIFPGVDIAKKPRALSHITARYVRATAQL